MRTSLRIPAVSRPPVVSALALTVGALWWWAVLRLVLVPAETGAVEGAVAVGGWGLGLLPVHCVPAPLRRARLRAGRDAPNGCAADPGGDGTGSMGAAGAGGVATRASTPHRSDAGSGPS